MRGAALLALLATVVAVVVTAPAEAERSSSACSIGGRTLRGGGPLEWKPTGRRLAMRGAITVESARTGSTMIVDGITRIGGGRRHGLAAFDLRTLRPLPFDPPGFERERVLAMAASPTTVYVAHRPLADEEARIAIEAFDLRTGARKPAFDPPDFRDGLLGAMQYAGGRVVIGGAPPVGAGITLGAYDPESGARLWQSPIDWPVHSIASDASRLYVDVDPEGGEGTPYRLVAAINPADGQPIPGWGASLRRTTRRTKITGIDDARIYPDFTLTRGLPRALAKSDGREVRLPDLPPDTTALHGGPGGVILGGRTIRISPGRTAAIDAVFSSTGKLIGTVCGTHRALTMTDARTIVAASNATDRPDLVVLRRPRR